MFYKQDASQPASYGKHTTVGGWKYVNTSSKLTSCVASDACQEQQQQLQGIQMLLAT